MTGKGRKPSTDEMALWHHITSDVIPLATTSLSSVQSEPKKAITGKRMIPNWPASASAPVSAPPPTVAPASPTSSTSRRGHLPGLDRKTSAKLRRGTLAIDARLDLHGMSQSLAHSRLIGFVRQAHGKGLRCVLVITGKGKDQTSHPGYGRPGILREMVPHWLAASDLKPLILSVTSAARHHGGGGAYYVYLRRDRSR